MTKNSSADAAKLASRGWSNDMSPGAVRKRLDKLAQLYRAWKQLNPDACSAERHRKAVAARTKLD